MSDPIIDLHSDDYFMGDVVYLQRSTGKINIAEVVINHQNGIIQEE